MQIRYLRLHNIRSYINEKIDFPSGTLLLCGDVGSGKSTILLAIEFALFGIKRGEFSGSALLRNGSDEGSVELKFSVGEREIIVHRKLKRTSKSVKQEAGYMLIDGQKLEGTPVELKSKVLEILGYPSSLITKGRDMVYRYTVYTPQEDMKNILFSDNEERLDTLRRVFNIDRYKRVRENLQIVLRDLRSKMNNMEGRIYDLPEKSKERKNLVAQINEITREAKALVPKIKEITETIASKSSELEDLEKRNISRMEEKKNKEYLEKERSSLNSRIKNSQKRLQESQNKLSKLKDKVSDEKMTTEDLAKLDSEIESLTKERDKMKEDNAVITQRLKDIKEEIDRLEEETKSKKKLEKSIMEKKQAIKSLEVAVRQKPEIEKNIEKVEKIISELNNRLAEAGMKHKTAETTISDISELSDCPTCHQKVTDEYKKEIIKKQKDLMKDIKSQKKELQDSIDGYELRLSKSKENLKILHEKERELERSNVELENLENNMKDFDSKRKRLGELQEKSDKMKKDIIPKEKISDVENRLNSLKKKQKEYNDNISIHKEIDYIQDSVKKLKEDINNDMKTLSETDQKIKISEDKIKSFDGIETKVKKIKDSLEKIRGEEKDLMVQKSSLLSKRNSLMDSKNALDEQIIEKRAIKEKMDKMLELKSWLSDYFSEMTVLMERSVMSRIFTEFDELFREWFNIMIEDEVISVRLDEEFTPIVEQNGYEIGIHDLSGGEKTSCALAYRLALNKVINDCIDNIKTSDLIILDEPTDGFSSEQLDRLRDVLGKLNISQVIIVSHEAKIESYVDNIIRISKTEHVSSVSS